jgi:SAM-dependent methyltransferase
MSLVALSEQTHPELRSDKSAAYLEFYEELFGAVRTKPLHILEVGVYHGGSLLMFGQYFEQSRLLGIDIGTPPQRFFDQLEALRLSDRIGFGQGSQSDTRFLDQAIRQHFGDHELDLVIDDASHLYKHTRATFEHIFYRYLKSGGIYVLEDWGCGYWPRWKDGNPNGRSGLPRLVKEFVDLLALRDRTVLFQGKRAMRVNEVQDSPIKRMIMLPAILALIKA